MTSKHYRWQARWSIDRGARTAAHSNGLVVRELADGRVEPVNAGAIMPEVERANGPHNAPQMLARWLREARELLGSGPAA